MADRGARYKVYEPIDDKNLLTPCCGADTPTCTFSASVANDQALSVARAELAVEQCASPFRYHIDHGTSLAQFGSAWKSLALGSAWPSVASTSKRLQTQCRFMYLSFANALLLARLPCRLDGSTHAEVVRAAVKTATSYDHHSGNGRDLE
jgi:hypothetical protein